jgi:hypothetical protein
MRKLRFRVLLLPLLCCLFGYAAAQDPSPLPSYRTKVVLKNRQVVRGYSFEPWLGGRLRLQLASATFAEIDSADIQKVSQQAPGSSQTFLTFRQKRHAGEYGQHRGFFHHVFIGPSFGERDLNLSMGLLNGYRFDDRYALALGVNYDRFARVAALPIYLQGRAYLINERVSFYTFADAGYSPAWENKSWSTALETFTSSGGLLGQLGLGYQVNYYKSALTFGLGYKIQKLHNQYEFYQYQYTADWSNPTLVKYMDIDERRQIRRVVLTVGISL